MHPLLLLLPIILALPCFNPPLTSLSPRGRPHMTFAAGAKVPFRHANFDNSSLPAVSAIVFGPAPAPAPVAPACDHEAPTPKAALPPRVSHADVCPAAVAGNPLARPQFSPAVSQAPVLALTLPVSVAATGLDRAHISPAVHEASQVFNRTGPAVPSQFGPFLNAASAVLNTTSLAPAPAPALEDPRPLEILAHSLPVWQASFKSDSAAAFSPGRIAALAAAILGLFAIALRGVYKHRLSSSNAPAMEEDVVQVDMDDSPPPSVEPGTEKQEADKNCSTPSTAHAVEEDVEEDSKQVDSPPAAAASETDRAFASSPSTSPVEREESPVIDPPTPQNLAAELSEKTDDSRLAPSPPTAPASPAPPLDTLPTTSLLDSPPLPESAPESLASPHVPLSPSSTGLPEGPVLPISTVPSSTADFAPGTDAPPINAVPPNTAGADALTKTLAPAVVAAAASESDPSPEPRPATSVRLTAGEQLESTKEEEEEQGEEGLEASRWATKAADEGEEEQAATKKGKEMKEKKRRTRIRRRKRRGREAVAGPLVLLKEEERDEEEREAEEKEEKDGAVPTPGLLLVEPLSSGSSEEPALSASRWAHKDEGENEDDGEGWAVVRKKQGSCSLRAPVPVKEEERKEVDRKTRREARKEKWERDKAKQEEKEKAREKQEIVQGAGPSSWADEVEADEEKKGRGLAVSIWAAAPDVKKESVEQGLRASKWASGRESEKKKDKRKEEKGEEELSWRSRSGDERPRAPQKRGEERQKGKGVAMRSSPFPAVFSSMSRAGTSANVVGGRSGRVPPESVLIVESFGTCAGA